MKHFTVNFCRISGLVPWAVLVPLEQCVPGPQSDLDLATVISSLLSRKHTRTISILNNTSLSFSLSLS